MMKQYRLILAVWAAVVCRLMMSPIVKTTCADVSVYPDPNPQPGDFNTDGQVEQADLNLLLQGWGDDYVPSTWTATFDGLLDQNELNDLLGNWGVGVEGAAAPLGGADVPEPATVVTLLFLAGGMTRFRRRR